MWANGRPALGLRIVEEDGTSRPHRLLVLDVDETGRVATLHAHGDPATMALFGV